MSRNTPKMTPAMKAKNKEINRTMENFSLDGITTTIVFDTRRAKKTEDPEMDLFSLYPIKYRITFMRKQYYYPSGIDLTEDEWRRLPDAKGKELKENRELIQSGFDKIKGHIKEMVKGEGFSIEGLSKRLSKGRKNSILAAFDRKIEDLNKTGQIGTAITYQCAINSISKYTTKDIRFSDITLDWLKKYEAHLMTEGKSITTIKFYIGCIRAIMNEGKSLKIISESQYPFGKGKYEIKTGTGRKMALTLPQIKAVLDYPLFSDTEKQCRDLWFFSYLCNGLNFNDMLKLKYKDISGGEIHFIRQKTKRTTNKQREIAATLLPQMKAIIDRWGNTAKKPDNYIFPFLSNGIDATAEKRIIQNVVRLTNKKMAKISKGLKFDLISTYTARHSYATVLKRSGANIAFISESLGHSDLRTTENYLASFEAEERAKNASKLTEF
jgi:integrase